MVPLRRGPPKLKLTSGLRPLDFGALYRPRRVPRTQFASSEMESVTDSGRNGEPDGWDRVKVHSPEIGAMLAAAGFTAAGSDLATDTGLLAVGGGWEAGGVVGGA